MNFDKHYECKGVHNAKVTKLKNKWLINIKSFLNSFYIYSYFTIKRFNYHNLVFIIAKTIVKNF